MTETWKNIFRQNIKCYEAIQTLHEYGFLDEEEKAVHEHNLLFDIIETMLSEIDKKDG